MEHSSEKGVSLPVKKLGGPGLIALSITTCGRSPS